MSRAVNVIIYPMMDIKSYKVYGGNTKIPTCAVDGAGTALNGCRPRNTAFDLAVLLSTGPVPTLGCL